MEHPAGKVDSDGIHFMTVDDTNALRASLGLKPLSVASASSATESSDSSQVEPSSPSSSSQSEPADEDVQRIREQILRSRQRRRELRLQHRQTLGELDPETEDVYAWAKSLGSEAAPASVSSTSSSSTTPAPTYESSDLAGATIRHSLSSIQPGEEITLTLKDTSVMMGENDDIDELELENDGLMRVEKSEFRRRLRTEKRLDPEAFEKEKEKEGTMFRLNEGNMTKGGADVPASSSVVGMTSVQGSLTDTWGMGLDGDEDAGGVGGDTGVIPTGFGNLTNETSDDVKVVRRRKKKKKKRHIRRKRSSGKVAPTTTFPPQPKFNPSTFLIPGLAPEGSFPKVEAPTALKSRAPKIPRQKKKAAVVFDAVNEFCRTLAVPKTEQSDAAQIKRRRRKKNRSESARKSEGYLRKEVSVELQKRALAAATEPRTTPPEVLPEVVDSGVTPDAVEPPTNELVTQPVLGEEELCSVDFGIASALRFVRQKKLLGAIRPGYEDDPDEQRVVRRTTTEDGVVLNEINIEYHDLYGRRIVDPHTAFNVLCYGFHGVKPGKNRREREQRKIVEEQNRKEMALGDTPLDGVAQLRQIQEEAESYFVKYSGNISDLSVAASNKRQKARKKRRKRKRKDASGGRSRKRRKVQQEPSAEDGEE